MHYRLPINENEISSDVRTLNEVLVGELAELSCEFDVIYPFVPLDLPSRLQNIESPDSNWNL